METRRQSSFSIQQLFCVSAGILGLTPFCSGQALDLFFSEYVEGSSFNKAVEIFNGTGADVNLDEYEFALYSNGSATVSSSVNLGTLQASLADGSVITLQNSGFGSAISGDVYVASAVNFNGDDSVALLKGGVVIDVIGEIGVRENIYGNTTLRRKSTVGSPVTVYDDTEWDSFSSDTFDDLGQHTFVGAGPPDPEPSEYPTGFSALVDNEGVVTLAWADSVGTDLPARYLIYAWTTVEPALPVDGVGVVTDLDFSDGTGVLTVNYGVQSVVLDALLPNTSYSFKIIPFSNGGLAADYKTNGVPPETSIAIPFVALKEGFADLDDWSVVTLGAEAEWGLSNGAVEANAFGSSGVADDWLISNLVDLSSLFGPVLRFQAEQGFDDTGFDPALFVQVSTDYDGSGTPTAVQAATWTALDVPLLLTAPSALTATSEIPLSGFGGSIYLAFQYVSSGTEGSTSEGWTIDTVSVFSSGEVPVSLGVSIDAPNLTEGSDATGTVLLSREPDMYPFVVTLLSSDLSELSVPASVSFDNASDGLSKPFTVSAVADADYDLDTSVDVTASATGSSAVSTSVLVLNADAAPALILDVSPSSVFENAGAQAATLEVRLPAAPLGGYPVTVTLESSNTAEATIPATISFNSSDNLVRSVSVSSLTDGTTDGNQTVTLTATSADFSAGSTTIEVIDVDIGSQNGVMSLSIQPNVLSEGSTATGTITLSTTVSTDLTVNLVSSDTSELSVPGSVTIPANTTIGTFSVSAVDDGIVDADQSANVIVSALDWIGAQASVMVQNVDQPRVLALSLAESSAEEGQFVTGTLTLSEPDGAAVVVDLTSTDLGEATVPAFVTLVAGQTVTTFQIEALSDGVVDGDVAVSILATSSGWAGAQADLTVLNVDEVKTATLVLPSTTINEGGSLSVEISLNQPVSSRTPVLFSASDDLVFPSDVFIESGADSAFFVLSAVEGDGFEGDEVVAIDVAISGYETTPSSLTIIESDPRGSLLSPVDGKSWSRGDTVLFEAEVADPFGTLDSVSFQIDGVEVASVDEAPYVASYTFPEDAALNQIELSLVASDSTFGDEQLDSVTGFVIFSPPLSDRDFVTQSYEDVFGDLTGADIDQLLLDLAAAGSREDWIVEFLESNGKNSWDAIQTRLLILDRFPGIDELSEDKGILEISGVVGLSQDLFIDVEAESRFGGIVAGLNTTEFFSPVWMTRHGVAPTAQQIVQASNRIANYTFGQADFIRGLIEEDVIDNLDIIFNPPASRLALDSELAFARLTLWRETSAFDRVEVSEVKQGDQADYVKVLLNDPNYWNRFNYVWLNSVQFEGAPDWYASEWFGTFSYTLETWPWIFHLEHGWIAAGSDDAQAVGAWWYDLELGWLWSSSRAYSWVFQAREQSWLWYFEGSVDPRYFYDTKSESWLEVD